MMTKYDLIREAAKEAHLDQATTAAAINGASRAIRARILAGDSVMLPKLGLLKVEEREAQGWDFHRHQPVPADPRLYVGFKPTRSLNDELKHVLGGIKSEQGQI